MFNREHQDLALSIGPAFAHRGFFLVSWDRQMMIYAVGAAQIVMSCIYKIIVYCLVKKAIHG